jgi:predicted Fe-Mo cluster-binding NifX family protein
MKMIAIASEDKRGLAGAVSAHFGRCPYYTLVQVDGERIAGARVEQNPHFGQHRPGVVPKFINSLGADAIVAGGMGPRAVQIFQQLGIEVATGAAGMVGDVLASFLQGELKGIVPCQHDHPQSCGDHGAGPASVTMATRVAVPAFDDGGLSSKMDPRFGRAPFFVLVDLPSGAVFETIPNTAAEEAHGAGTTAASLMGKRSVGAVIAGRFGPKAAQVLDALGIERWTVDQTVTIGQAVERLVAGELRKAG